MTFFRPAWILAAALSIAAPAMATDITECSQGMRLADTAELVDDLECSNGEPALILTAGTTLRLNGHTIAGGNTSIFCRGDCTIIGPGVLDGLPVLGGSGIELTNDTLLRVKDVTIRNRTVGIAGWHARRSGIRIRLDRVTIENCSEYALAGAGITARDVTITNCGDYFDEDVQGTVVADLFRGRNVTVSGNHSAGIYATRRVRVRGLTAVDNEGVGVNGIGRVSLFGSTVEDNDAGGGGIDVSSTSPPNLKETSCGRSGGAAGGAWGVCADD